MQPEINYSCYTDRAGKKRYYVNGKFTVAKSIPPRIRDRIPCPAREYELKLMPSKTMPLRPLRPLEEELAELNISKLTEQEFRDAIEEELKNENKLCGINDRKGFVYFIREEGSTWRVGDVDYPRIKVGITCRRLDKRLAELQTGNSRKLTLVAYSEYIDPRPFERTLHRLLVDRWILGEWFAISNEDIGRISDELSLDVKFDE